MTANNQLDEQIEALREELHALVVEYEGKRTSAAAIMPPTALLATR